MILQTRRQDLERELAAATEPEREAAERARRAEKLRTELNEVREVEAFDAKLSEFRETASRIDAVWTAHDQAMLKLVTLLGEASSVLLAEVQPVSQELQGLARQLERLEQPDPGRPRDGRFREIVAAERREAGLRHLAGLPKSLPALGEGQFLANLATDILTRWRAEQRLFDQLRRRLQEFEPELAALHPGPELLAAGLSRTPLRTGEALILNRKLTAALPEELRDNYQAAVVFDSEAGAVVVDFFPLPGRAGKLEAGRKGKLNRLAEELERQADLQDRSARKERGRRG